MSNISKGACGLIAAMYVMIGFSHLSDPEASLRDFGVKGDISPIAKHCCAIIGSTGVAMAAVMVYAISAPASVRTALLWCFLTSIIPGTLVQVWYPFNDPPPKPPLEMPYPVIALQVVLGLVGIMTNGKDEKSKTK
jgi:hypothetical protein